MRTLGREHIKLGKFLKIKTSDWIRALVAVTNEILKRESSKCILDPPRVEGRGTRILTLG
jgi:hypothetical protein